MISVVIPHYKGKEKLYAYLKHNSPFLSDCQIIVVNDYPKAPLTSEMKKLFPNVSVVENKKNLGFAAAVRVGISLAKYNYVLLLNNDVLLHDERFKKTIHFFREDKTLFAISFRQSEKNGCHVGRNMIYWKNGFFYHSKANAEEDGINGWAEGGSMLFDKQKYDRIGGFDSLYSPFYWEDVDLSYRAWKAGYTIRFNTDTTVEHHHESTIGSYFQKSQIKTIAYRNQLITIWKNISSISMLAEHTVYLLRNYFSSLFKRDYSYVRGFWMAIALLPQIVIKRKQQKKMWKMSDKDIFNKFI